MFRFSEYKLRNFNFRIVILIAALCTIGFLILSSAMANDADRDATLQKQLMGFGIGAAAMIFFALMDYHFIMKIAPLVYIGMLVLLGVILIPGVGTSANNATRWLNLGFMQIQPSEFAKIGIIMVFASFFMANRERISKVVTVGTALLLFAVPAAMILAEPDLSTTLVITFIFLSMIYVAKLSYKWIFGAVARRSSNSWSHAVYCYAAGANTLKGISVEPYSLMALSGSV